MSRNDIKAGGDYVELLLRKKSFMRGLSKAASKLKSFGRAAKRIGSFGILGGGGGGRAEVFGNLNCSPRVSALVAAMGY